MSSTDVESKQNQQPSNDLVLLDGFPALKKKENGEPDLNPEQNQIIPQHTFWACETALCFAADHLHALREDCGTVFTARTLDDYASYSAGITYFLPCAMKPRCALESLVQSIFTAHTAHVDTATYDVNLSGAEWWTLVMDEEQENGVKMPLSACDRPAAAKSAEEDDDEEDDDEVGMHFDADYGLESQAPGVLLHPRVATVTYLSDFGAPTVVLECRSPPPRETEELSGPVDTCWLSHPSIGKHMAFDGRLLHGAPSVFFPPRAKAERDQETSNKKAKSDTRRITLMVNVWLNHCPYDADPLEEEVIAQLKAPHGDDESASFSWQSKIDWSSKINPETIKIATHKADPAGSEEFVICNRLVTITYGASMESLHKASSTAGLLQIDFDADALSLFVGGAVEADEESEEP